MWFPVGLESSLPMYLAIVEAIERDINRSVLSLGDKLPPQRTLADHIGIDFTTVSRAYKEAKKRGLLVARVGQGTFVSAQPENASTVQQNKKISLPSIVDMTMNIPPALQDVGLVQRMKQEMAETVLQMEDAALFRYQDFFGTVEERTIAAKWISSRFTMASPENVMICPGTQSPLLALLKHLVFAGSHVCSEKLTYPGFLAIVEELGLSHAGLDMDEDGIIPEDFERACEKQKISVLYCTPTQHNPTTTTWSQARREQIAAIARRYKVKVIEDDAYGFLTADSPPPLCSWLPDHGFYIAGLAKCLSSALRVSFLCCPDRNSIKELSNILRATSLMASPITKAMATSLIQSGCADMIRHSIIEAAVHRQKLARQLLKGQSYRCHPQGFHLWLSLPPSWTQEEFIDQMRDHSVRLVNSAVFSRNGDASNRVRICLGAINTYEKTRDVLHVIQRLLENETGFSDPIV